MNKFLESIGVETDDVNIYIEAFTHKSFLNENKNISGNDYERLEFMGDAVLELLTTEYLFRNFPELAEGDLTKLRQLAVRSESLAKYATQLKLYEIIKLGKGEKNRHRESLLADIFEAFLGALYIDGQSEAIIAILSETVYKALSENEFSENLKNYKADFQELIQADNRGDISYVLTGTNGPDHDRIFIVELHLDDIVMGKGKGTSKKEAENFAAKDALLKLSK